MNTDTAANDLTQLSSREQLSALMDSALPPDQTRFLLRRLQHDAPLAACWERWRIAGEVMRGLAPARHMPADFAARVSAALHDGEGARQSSSASHGPSWLRWGGGAAVAASLAVVALMARQAAPVSASQPAPQVAAAATQPQVPVAKPVERAIPVDGVSRSAAAAVAVAAVGNSQRRPQPAVARGTQDGPKQGSGDAVAQTPGHQVAALEPVVQLPPSEIVTRPWPRSVLPQYGSGGLTVGFGEHVSGSLSYNPFQPTPVERGEPAQAGADGDAAGEAESASSATPGD